MNYYWQLPDGRIWGFQEAAWVTKDMLAGDGALSLVMDLDELRNRIRFYKGDLGALAEIGDMKPGDDYTLIDNKWVKTIYTRKEFLLWVGLNNVVAINQVADAGNPLLKTLLELVQASEYIDIQDPDTVQLVQMMTTSDAGSVLSSADAARILAGKVWTVSV